MRPAGMDPIVTSKKTMGFFGLGGLRCHSTATVGVAAAAAAATTTLLLLLFVAAPPEAIAARESEGGYTREDESGREKRAGGTTQMTVLEDGWSHNPKLGLGLTWARLGQFGRPIAVALGNHVLGLGLTSARVSQFSWRNRLQSLLAILNLVQVQLVPGWTKLEDQLKSP